MGAEAGPGGLSGSRPFFRRTEGELVAHVRHAFTLAQIEGGSRYRDHLEASARRGNADAKRKLVSPEYPKRYTYLVGWFYELHQRRGLGPNGPAPLSWSDCDAWARRTDRNPSPWEWHVIGLLDHAFLTPDEETPVEQATPKVEKAWPEARS